MGERAAAPPRAAPPVTSPPLGDPPPRLRSTGQVLTEENQWQIVEFFKKEGLVLLADEVMSPWRRRRSLPLATPRRPASSPPINRPGMELQQLINQTKQWISEQPVEQIYIAVAVLFITFAVFLIFSFLRTSKSNTIVLAGLSGSGKTVLFYQLRDGSPHQGTVTSMEPNDDTFVLHFDLPEEKKKKTKKTVPLHLIDVPGHPRLKPKLDDYLPQAAGLVFTVDAQDFLYNYQAAAE